MSTGLKFMSSLLLIALALVSSPPAVQADIPLEVGSSIRVEAVTATPARQGDSSRIRFRIVNGSRAPFHVLGIDTPVAREVKLVARIGDVETTVLESIGAPAGETLDLTTSHLWYKIGPLTRDLRSGETFEMRVRFVGGQLTVPVHVHEASLGP